MFGAGNQNETTARSRYTARQNIFQILRVKIKPMLCNFLLPTSHLLENAAFILVLGKKKNK